MEGKSPIKEAESNAESMKQEYLHWKILHYNLDPNLAKSQETQTATNIAIQSSTNDLQEISEINLEYELEQIWDSVLANPENTLSEGSMECVLTQAFLPQASTVGTKYLSQTRKKSDLTDRRTAQEEYDFALEQSQKLLEESQGFIEMPLNEPTSKIEPIENSAPMDSQDLSENLSEVSLPNTTFQSSFTKLSDCKQNGVKVNIFVVVLQVNPVKEMLVKSGIHAGSHVNVSSILVADPTNEYFKLTFWRKAAEWVTTLVAGNVIVVRKLKIQQWSGEFYGQNTFETSLVNLRNGTVKKIPPNWLMFVNKGEARSLLQWLETRHPYIGIQREVPVAFYEVKWQTLSEFKPSTLTHYRAKIVKVFTHNNLKGRYHFGSKARNKIMVVAIDLYVQKEIPICLWGHQADWQYELKSTIGQVWDFKFLRVECEAVYDELVLHTTPQSTKTPAYGNLPFCQPMEDHARRFQKLSDLLKANLNGNVIVSVNVVKISIDDLSISKVSDLKHVKEFFKQLTYLGCKTCARPLKQDQNGIYIHCTWCRRSHVAYSYGVTYCYKQCQIQLSDISATINATLSHNSTTNFMKDFDIQDILEGSVGHKLFKYMCTVFASQNKVNVTLSCQTKMDENSFVQNQAFKLIALEV